ncbi:hypothetical protein [Alcaligenes aquatilis]|uniref:hypothetical protein n=1 Tax=Alcaligenes aquatilis TaxID=323284 RepID=UPI003F908FD8
MTIKTRFTSSRIVLLSLTASLFSTTAQADLLGASPLAIPANLNLSQNLRTAETMLVQPGPLETSLANTGQAVDNILPVGLRNYGQRVGLSADQIVDIQDIEPWRARIMEAIDLGTIIDSEGVNVTLDETEHGIDIVGILIENANLPLNAGQATGNLLHGVSDTVGSARGLLHNDPNHPNPISSTLENLTGSLAATSEALLHSSNQLQPLLGAQTTALNNNAGLLAPVTNLVDDGLTGGLAGGNVGNDGLLSPITGLAHSLTGGLTGGTEQNAGLLAPVTHLVSSVTGGLGGDTANNPGLLAPITGLLGNGLLSPPAATTEMPPGNTVAATNVGLLSPVTGLINGLLGAPPR